MQNSRAAVGYINNVITGRAENSYQPYDHNGNPIVRPAPNPDLPGVKDVDPASVNYCEGDRDEQSRLTQRAWEKIKSIDWGKVADKITGAVDAVKDWARSEQGQRVIKGGLTVVSVAAVVAAVVAVSNPVGASALIGAGVASLVSGKISELTGGSFVAGWIGGAVAGAFTGAGLGVAGNILTKATGVGVSAGEVLGGFVKATATASGWGTAGGAAGSMFTQWVEGNGVDFDEAMSAGLVNGVVAGLATPYTLVSSTIGGGAAAVGKAISALIEGVFDTNTGAITAVGG